MINALRTLVLVLIATSCLSLTAQTVDQYDVVLLPLTARGTVPGFGSVPGNFGSEWVTDLAITNVSDTPVLVLGYWLDCGGVLCSEAPRIPPHTTIITLAAVHCAVQGTFLYIERGRSHDIAVTLRSRDISRQLETWGTTVPVVSFDQLFGRRFAMVDIPIDPQFRSTLRLYDVNGAIPPSVRVRIYAIENQSSSPAKSDTLLMEMTPSFLVPTTGGGIVTCPTYFEMSLSALPVVANARRIRVEVEPLDGAHVYWGMVSVTHNVTQHATIILPN